MFMGTMCDVLSEYSQFFQQGMSILATIDSDVPDYRAHIIKVLSPSLLPLLSSLPLYLLLNLSNLLH